jgi:ribosomal protein S18 acetylase RimI-like enzyme
MDLWPVPGQHGCMDQDLRAATGDDLGTVEAIVRSAYAHYVSRIGREPAPMLDDHAQLIRDGRVHVIEHQGEVQGVLVLIPQEDAMLLDNVAVSPSAQGRGLGRKLLQFAEAASVAAGYRCIRLYTNAAMTENIELYTRIGYCETHRVEEKGLRRVYMMKPVG